jgi:alkaline phosphatase D
MSFSRRDFLKVSGVTVSSLWLSSAFGDCSNLLSFFENASVPILQTYTNETSAQFRILVATEDKLIYKFQKVSSTSTVSKTLEHLDRYIHPAWPQFAVDHIIAEGLRPGAEYQLLVIDAQTGNVRDQRVFTALDRSQKTGRSAIISCLCDDFPDAQKEMWSVVANQNPDVVFLIGDAVYLDGRQSDDEAGMWRRHLEVRKSMDLFRWKRLRPVISVWDDHDFGINDGDRDFPLKNATRQMFEAMFGSDATDGLSRGPSLALEASLFGQRFYLMDDRYYRTKSISQGSHWGEKQEDWLFSRLDSSDQPSFLMNGSQYFGAYAGYESFEGQHPDQFARVLKQLSKQQAPVIFASGDRHFSELMRIEPKLLGYETLELTSSSLHSYAPDQIPAKVNPRRLLATREYNFILVDSTALTGALDVKTQTIGPGSRILFRHQQVIRRS